MSTSSATIDTPARPAPTPPRQLLPNGVMGMAIFIFTEVMLFAGLVSAHEIVRSQSIGEMWPPYGQPRLSLGETAINTAALLLSGFVLYLANRIFKQDKAKAVAPTLVALLLGIFFVGAQGAEWVALLGDGLTMTSSTYGAFFYTIVGTHGLHALSAILALGWAWSRLRTGKLTATEFTTVQVFWYFVVLVWPFLYLQVYL